MELKIKMDSARVKAKKDYFRRRLREHKARCAFCNARRS
jgi:hypothetical protein